MTRNKKESYIIKVYCEKCQNLLYRYRKEGGGHLIKCYKDGIIRDYTGGDLKCLKCGQVFAREAMIHGRPTNKIIQGKVYVKR